MKTNIKNLVKVPLVSICKHPSLSLPGLRASYDGLARLLPGVGGITYSHYLGDNCIDIVGDHIEAGVSSVGRNDKENNAYMTWVCVGNRVKVISGLCSGRYGVIVGKHGGCNHVMIAFSKDVIENLTYDDKFMVTTIGQGLELLDYPSIKCMNIDPYLLDKLNIKQYDNYIELDVKKIIPSYAMGAGIGSSTIINGDYDIMLHDQQLVKEYNLDTLAFGDIVMIKDHLNYNGPDYLKGSITIGVIVHSNSYTSGHGPGVCVLLTSNINNIKVNINNKANLKYILDFNKDHFNYTNYVES